MQDSKYEHLEMCMNLLGIYSSDDLTPEKMKEHWRKKIKLIHPDVTKNDGEKAKELNAAYDWLADPEQAVLIQEYRQLHTKAETTSETNFAVVSHYSTDIDYSSKRKYKTAYPAEDVDGRLYNLEKCIWQPVISSNIRFVYYDSYRKYLFVIFKSSQALVYCYLDVPYETYYTFMHAPSLGSYVNKYIKPRYKCVRMATVISEADLSNYMEYSLPQ